jgi:hypothetical protein
MRIVRGNGGKATVLTHTELEKVELVIRDDEGESTIFLTPHRARRLAEFLSSASDRAEGDERVVLEVSRAASKSY